MKYMKERGFEVVMISSPGADAELVEQQEECEMITLPMKRTISPFADLQALIRLTRILKNLQPDIVHTHTPKAGLLGMLAARLAGVPVRLHTIAGLPWMESRGLKRLLLRQLERFTASLAHRVYPNSTGLLQFLQEQRVAPAPGKLKLLGNGSSNGIDCTFFSRNAVMPEQVAALRQQSGLQPGGWVWIFAGRLVREKGIHELLEAFLRVNESYPNDQLWLLGAEEPQRDPLAAEDRQLIASHLSIHAWGFQHDVRPYFAAADVLVFPSYREGMPNVPLQAGALECALLLSDINGCNEIVVEGENGFLFPTKDSKALFRAMQQVREDEALKTSFGVRSRERIQALYGREEVWRLIEEEYRSMLRNEF